ncbi:MAG: hypothetical protein F4Z28_13130 [Gammaproteobacteria bacterium]|nr:hypothetical protein [Gammaproteobacteria bacterium]
MHSSGLRGSDFHLTWLGCDVSHRDFFRNHTRHTRVGLLAPGGTEGVGAVTLAMACVTAFYDDLRTDGAAFFAYPDFFTFQRGHRLADYGAFDFWPDKDVKIAHETNGTLAAIADRAVNVLLVPEAPVVETEYEPFQIERARRVLTRCFAYSPHGEVADPQLVIRCDVEPFRSYAAKVLRSVGQQMPDWLGSIDEGSTLQQSFRELECDDALSRLQGISGISVRG